MSEAALACALGRCESRHAPDDRVAVFDVEASWTGETAVLSGSVQDEYLLSKAVAAVETATDAGAETGDVAVLEDVARDFTVTDRVAPVRGDPSEDGERVTEALYGAALTGYDDSGAWTRVRTPDGYVGWVHGDALADATDVDPAHLLVEDVGADDVDADDGFDVDVLPAGTECAVRERAGDAVAVTFRTGATARLLASAVGRPPASPTGEDVVANAERYFGTEYRWGGMTVDGIDCSGLSWMSYRLAGLTLPRDADQQRHVGEEIDPEPEQLRAGDLLFFPGHVAVSRGGAEYVHASGTENGVIVSSLDPADDRYVESRAENLEMATRIL